MAITKSDPIKLKAFIDAYAVATRAGVITPCLQDENEIRKIFGLSAAPIEVIDDWKKSNGVRRPITLSKSATDDQNDGTVITGDQENVIE